MDTKPYMEIKNVGNKILHVTSHISDTTSRLEYEIGPGATVSCYTLNNGDARSEELTFIFKDDLGNSKKSNA